MNTQFASRRDSMSAMFDPDCFFQNSLADLKADGRYRTFLELERRAGAFPLADCPGRPDPVVVWCSNDYLGTGQHPVVLAAMHEAVDRVGTGAGGTRNISGNTRDHVLLERELADLHGKEAALVFATGYVTNEAALSTLAGLIPGCIVYSDALNHASMIAGIRHSKADKRIFRHNDPQDLERLMAADDPSRPKLVCFESVYSMDADVAKPQLVDPAYQPPSPCDRTKIKVAAQLIVHNAKDVSHPDTLRMIKAYNFAQSADGG